MSHPWQQYLIFLAEVVTLVIAILIVIAGVIALASKNKMTAGSLTVRRINEKLDEIKNMLREEVLDKKELKKLIKIEKAEAKKTAKEENKKRVFLINFDGDIKASQTTQLREEITAVLQIATPQDEVVVKLESPGGMVAGYGLAASQLARLKEQNIPLTVCVDKVAASGGYMMAAVADHIVAAPFAIIGSIGVIAQIPNFHRLLKRHDIDFEQVTAGKYKRTLTIFGENTREGREKMQEDLEEIHAAFKEHIAQFRPTVNMDQVATGEHWLAVDAAKLHLVDRLMTSDDYLLFASKHADVFEIRFHTKKSFMQKLQGGVEAMWRNVIGGIM